VNGLDRGLDEMMAGAKDYYVLLGLSHDASEDQVRQAYRKLARQYHPDLNPGNSSAEDRFKEINAAYEVLSDASARKQYDELVEAAKRPPEFGPDRSAHINVRFTSRPRRKPKRGALSGILEYVFGGPKAQEEKARRKSPGQSRAGRTRDGMPRQEAELAITLEEAHRGAVRKLTINEPARCPSCRGGKKAAPRGCPVCGGAGVLKKSRVVDFSIPPGARDGSVIKVPARQMSAPGAGHSYDLYIRLLIRPHEAFSVDGDDLHADLHITPWEAVFGATIEVPTIDGKKAEMKIPASALGGQRLRLRAHGLNTRDGARGDLYVRLNIVVPPEPSDRERELFRELAKISRFQPR